MAKVNEIYDSWIRVMFSDFAVASLKSLSTTRLSIRLQSKGPFVDVEHDSTIHIELSDPASAHLYLASLHQNVKDGKVMVRQSKGYKTVEAKELLMMNNCDIFLSMHQGGH